MVNLWAVGTVGAHPLDVVKALAADQLGLRQRDDQLPALTPRLRTLIGAARRSHASSPSINPTSPKRRASAPTTAKPAYGVNDSSSARKSIRPSGLHGDRGSPSR